MTTDEQPPISDDDRARQEWANAALRGTFKHVLPSFWPALIGTTLALASTALAVYGTIRLTHPWDWLAIAWAAGAITYFVTSFLRAKPLIEANNARPIRERREALLTKMHEIESSSRWRFLHSAGFWRDRLIYTLPRAILTATALTAWWPLTAAVTAAAIPMAWTVISKLAVSTKRISPVISMMTEPRGPEGLPTPEI